MKNSEYQRQKLREGLLRAWGEFLSGSPGSDEHAATSLLFLAEIEVLTHASAVRTANFLRTRWLEKSLQAARNDPDFFRRLAKLIETEQKEPRSSRAHYFALLACMRLCEDPSVDPETITKSQVKTMAQRWWAYSRLIRAGKIADRFHDQFDDERENLIAREINNLPKQRWQDIWKHPEFSSLRNATRGRKRKIVDS